MANRLAIEKRPCSTCPYVRTVPSGVWEASEYEKLPAYDDGAFPSALGIFLCHHSMLGKAETVCRGWLSVHAESPAARLAVLTGVVTDEERYADVGVPLYASGLEAARAGMRDVEEPGAEALRLVAVLGRKRDQR